MLLFKYLKCNFDLAADECDQLWQLMAIFYWTIKTNLKPVEINQNKLSVTREFFIPSTRVSQLKVCYFRTNVEFSKKNVKTQIFFFSFFNPAAPPPTSMAGHPTSTDRLIYITFMPKYFAKKLHFCIHLSTICVMLTLCPRSSKIPCLCTYTTPF